MARAPSYDFERRERHKAKEAKRAEKTKAKAEKKAGEAGAEEELPAQPVVDETGPRPSVTLTGAKIDGAI